MLTELLMRIGFDVDDSELDGAAGRVQKWANGIGTSALAAGAGMEAFARTQADTNKATTDLAQAMGISSDAVRNLAIDVGGVGDPMDEMLALMKTGQELGLSSADSISMFASTWDTVADATGESGTVLAEASSSLATMGISAENTEDAMAAFGYITQNTTGSVEDFLGFLNKSGTDLNAMGLSVNDTAALLGYMEQNLGLTGKAARGQLNEAIKESDGDLTKMLTSLGLTQTELDGMTAAVEGSSGVLEQQAQNFADNQTAMEGAQQWAEELTFKYGALGQVAGDLAGPIVALGTVFSGIGTIMSTSAAKTAGSWIATKISLLTTWAQLKAMAIADSIKTAAAWVGSNVKTAASFVATKAVTVGTTIAGWATMSAQAAVHAAKITATWIASNAKTVASFVASMAVAVATTVAGWVVMGIQALINAAKMAVAWLIAMGPVAIIIAIVIGLVALIIANWETIKQWTIDIFTKVWEFIKGVWDGIVEAFNTALDFIVGIVTWYFTTIFNVYKTVFTAIWDFLVGAWEFIKGIFTGALEFIVGFVQGAWDTLKAGVKTVWDWITTAIDTYVTMVMNYIEFIGDIPGKIGEWLGQAYQFVKDKFTSIVDFVKGVPGKIAKAASGMFDSISGAFKGAINTIIGAWNNLSFTIGGGNVLGMDIPSFTLGTPDIPYLAEGGITQGPTLAMIGEGREQEAVLPLSKLEGLLRMGKEERTPVNDGQITGNTFNVTTLETGLPTVRGFMDEWAHQGAA